MASWSCNCPICRLFVHPVLQRVSPPRAPPTSSLATEAPPEEAAVSKFEALAERAPITPNKGEQEQVTNLEEMLPQPQIYVVEARKAEETEGHVEMEAEPRAVEVTIPQELIERIEQLEEEVGKLRSELSTINESIKNILVETRELLAEATSPFNVLRMAQRPSTGHGNGGRKGGNGSGEVKPSTRPSKFINIARIALKILNDFGKDKAIEIMRGYAEIGVIDKSTGETLVKIVDFVDRTRRMGISLEKQVPYLYALTRVLGIQDPELDELILKELMRGGETEE